MCPTADVSSDRFADRHCTTKVGVRVDEGRLWPSSGGIEKPGDEASECSAKRNVADLHVSEANRPEPFDVLLRYSGCVLADRLGIGKHFNVSLA